MTGFGDPPPKPTYVADGTGRDTYIRRDPVEQHGKHLYKAEPRLITRFGAAGSALTRDRHSGHAGFHPGERDNSVGGQNGAAHFDRPARFLRVPSDTFPIEINKFSTMKQITLDSFSKPPASGARSHHHSQISGFAGFIPRCPIAADPEASKWIDLVVNREEMLRAMFAQMDLNADGKVSKEEVAKLCEVRARPSARHADGAAVQPRARLRARRALAAAPGTHRAASRRRALQHADRWLPT